MAWRRLTKEANSARLRAGAGLVSPRLAAPARTFYAAPARTFYAASPAANPGGEFRVFGLFRSPLAGRADAVGISSAVGRNGVEGVWSRCSGPAFRAGAPNFGGLVVGRMARGFYPQLSGHKLIKGLGTGSSLVAMLCSQKVAYADEQPSEDIVGPSAKRHITKLWPLVRKYQLPVGVIALIALGWQNPLGLLINILLILYSSTPNPYSIYLFLQEIRHGEVCQNPALWKEEAVLTRKVDAKDYKFFSIGTVETADREVLHVIGILGSWWIYRASYGKLMGGRKIGVAVDFSSCSKAALRWASTNLTRSGDQLILIHVNSSCQNEQGAVHLWEQSGSPLIPLVEFSNPHVAKTYAVSPDKETLEILTQMSNQRGVEVLAKIFYGDPAKKLYEAVDLVPLNCLVVGNRGLSTLKRALMGSVSSYIVNNATCPVTVKENI